MRRRLLSQSYNYKTLLKIGLENEQPQVEPEATVEPQTETVEADEIELEAEADDDLLEGEFEAETDEAIQEETEAQEEQLYTVEVDGVTKEVTLDELTRDILDKAIFNNECKTLQNLKRPQERTV